MAVMVVTALLAGLAVTACSEEDPSVRGEGAPGIDAAAINQLMFQHLADTGAVGATVAVTRRGRLVWSTAYGWANEAEKIPMQPWHRSKIGSVSKVITAIGLLQQLEPPSGGLLAPGSGLKSQLSRKLYGHPGTDVTDPTWPDVTEATAFDDPETYWDAIRDGVQSKYPQTFAEQMARFIEWGSAIEVRHLLTHTSGHLSSTAFQSAADEYAGGDYYQLTYPQLHRYMLEARVWVGEDSDTLACVDEDLLADDPIEDLPLAGGVDDLPPPVDDELGAPEPERTIQLPPLRFEPGTRSCYSNLGFALLGGLIEDLTGQTYPDVIRQNMLEPLGLTNVVPQNVDISDLDAWPHGSTLDPESPSHLGMPTGGWSASAKDMVRILCALDQDTTRLRLLRPSTVSTMETVAFPEVDATQPLGFDSRGDHSVSKNGAISGGRSLIIKYLPGQFEAAPDDEINIAVNVNSSGSPTSSLLTGIAGIVAAAGIPDDYDLFDPAYPCVVEEELGLVNPTPNPTPTTNPTPTGDPTLVAPSPTRTASQAPTVVNPTRTRPVSPTVSIRSPLNGWQPAPDGAARIGFSGLARDAAGTAIPGTRYRWTATEAGTTTVLCAGSDFGPPPTTSGGLTALVDCTEFTRTLYNPGGGEGPSITIRLE
ncbi:MAG TPA: serine hydrolase domain-containing protein, partial [Micromonosporaceae bacterium]